MRAAVAPTFGDPEVLQVETVADPVLRSGEVLIQVAATAVNRADTLQRRGYYPPPPGVSDIIGLECSGTIVEVADDVTGWSVGDTVCALLAGGGYASLVAVPAVQVMPVPAGLDVVSAAALPEVACTVWSNVYMAAGLLDHESILVHGGGGGIGTFAIQLAQARGNRVFTTAGSADKLTACVELGADVAINYREDDFVEVILEATDGEGVDVILDNMGASYLQRNLTVLGTGGRLAIIGMQGGTKGELNIGRLLQKRATVLATSLRPRPAAEKGLICHEVVREVWPLVEAGRIKPVVHAVLPLEEAAEAHRMMELSSNVGKIVLTT
ncbi:NAD(P)H-quinone oxidoreductase [Georgenia ruanii]|uniref:Zinc-binding dehydrogenase n=1 Tax=Georgenia ruanii TaxID=348442 RepID=A0A7J9UV29_9MICO|nr:NAD(P)H-quinone oxidoreductase [Georgenia ruanii]MPV88499.1 zinc-binding dehydrogenase [Georgenia ruanii]